LEIGYINGADISVGELLAINKDFNSVLESVELSIIEIGELLREAQLDGIA